MENRLRGKMLRVIAVCALALGLSDPSQAMASSSCPWECPYHGEDRWSQCLDSCDTSHWYCTNNCLGYPAGEPQSACRDVCDQEWFDCMDCCTWVCTY